MPSCVAVSPRSSHDRVRPSDGNRMGCLIRSTGRWRSRLPNMATVGRLGDGAPAFPIWQPSVGWAMALPPSQYGNRRSAERWRSRLPNMATVGRLDDGAPTFLIWQPSVGWAMALPPS